MSDRIIRVIWRSAPAPQRTITEDALIREIDQMTTRDFRDVPPGPITFEALDDQHRVTWRAYYASAHQLPAFASMLRSERPTPSQTASR